MGHKSSVGEGKNHLFLKGGINLCALLPMLAAGTIKILSKMNYW